jgi:citrate synthase
VTSLRSRPLARARLGGPLVDLATRIEQTVVEVLAELKPGRHLYADVEFYAGVGLHGLGR